MSHKNVCQVLGKSSGGIAQNLTLSYLILYLWTGVIPRCANHESPPSSILGVFPSGLPPPGVSDRYDTVRPARIISNIEKEWERRNLRGSKDLIGRKDLIISFLLISGLGTKK